VTIRITDESGVVAIVTSRAQAVVIGPACRKGRGMKADDGLAIRTDEGNMRYWAHATGA
jgi:hypothetical protein